MPPWQTRPHTSLISLHKTRNYGRVSFLYANWFIWSEKHFVEFIEKIYLEEGRDAALKDSQKIEKR